MPLRKIGWDVETYGATCTKKEPKGLLLSGWDFSGETGASSGRSWWLENKSEARGWAFVVAGGSALGLFASLDLRTHAKGGSQSTF